MLPASQALADLSAEDLRIGGLTVFGEARGEIFQGKIAVSWSILNRVLIDLWGDRKPDWWGEGVRAVCLKSAQYTCWSGAADNRANRAAMDRASFADPVYLACHAAFVAVIAAARTAPFGGDFATDPTYGATHYYVIGSREPSWARGKTPVVRIGAHAFFNDIEPGSPNHA